MTPRAGAGAMMGAMDSYPVEALLAACSPAMAAVAEELRALVGRVVPDAMARVRPRWQLIGYDVPLGRRKRYFAWSWLTFLPGQAVDDDRLAPLLHDAVRVATMTRGERLLSVLDRDAAP